MAEVKLRDAVPDDLNFVYSTMLRGLYYGNEFYGEIDKKPFFVAYDSVIKQMLHKSGMKLVIACLTSEPDAIVGWALLEPQEQVLHFLYVKDPWRKKGIANQLLAGYHIDTVTHITKVGNIIRKQKGWVLNPFKI